MDVLYLRPSEIRFCQDSINNVFDKRSRHSNTFIGETLDALCNGIYCVEDIPNISVMRKNGKWFAADNRRLWVFKHLERHGKCREIPVYQIYSIPHRKLKTLNDGESVRVRGDPKGIWYSKPAPNFSVDIPACRTFLPESESRLGNLHPTYSAQNKSGEQHCTAVDKRTAKAERVIPVTKAIPKYSENASSKRNLFGQHNRRENSVPTYPLDRLRILTPVTDDITRAEPDICEQEDSKQTPNSSVIFQSLKNRFEIKTQHDNIVPKYSTPSRPESEHSTVKDVRIAKADPEMHVTKKTMRSSDSPLTECTQPERHTRFSNRLPSYSSQNRIRTQTAVVEDIRITRAEHDICEQEDSKQTTNSSVSFQTLKNMFEIKTQHENLIPYCSTPSRPESEHSNAKDVRIAKVDPEIHVTKTTVRSSDSPVTERTQSERNSKLSNRFPSYSTQNRLRTQTAVAEDIPITTAKSKVREQEVNTPPVTVVTRPTFRPEIQETRTTSEPSESTPIKNSVSESHRLDLTTASSLIPARTDRTYSVATRHIHKFEILATETTPKSCDGIPIGRSLSNKHNRLDNSLTTYSTPNYLRVRPGAVKDLCKTTAKPDVRQSEVNRPTVPVMITPVPKKI